MCRLFGFRSAVPSQAHRSLIAAENALVQQSREHPDGWGIAYYVNGYPHIYRNVAQAMGDSVFKHVSSMVSTHTLLAHIRKATTGGVNLFNCHPFQFGHWVFAHNGEIKNCEEGSSLRGEIIHQIDPTLARSIIGTTDSELVFFLFLTRLQRYYPSFDDRDIDFQVVATALKEAVVIVQKISQAHHHENAKLTIVLTNGSVMMGLRCGRELNFSTHKQQCPERESCPAYEPALCESPVRSGQVKHLIISSEHVAATPNVWTTLQNGELIGVTADMELVRQPLLDASMSTFEKEIPCC